MIAPPKAHSEIISHYGEQRIIDIYAKAGDVIFANTLGIHKGEKPKSLDRNICFINFVIEEEYGGSGIKLKIPKKYYNYLSPEAKEFGEYLEIING